MGNRSLIIGTGTGGIGDAVKDAMLRAMALRDPGDGELFGFVDAPLIDEMDVRDENGIDGYVADNGPFDHIVYSAGVSKLEWIGELNQRSLDKTLDINLTGMILLASAHADRFPDHPVRFVAIVSDAAHTPMRGSMAYCVSKAGQEMAMKVMARELAPLWTVVGVSPGVVDDTGMTNQLAKDIPEFRDWTPEQARAYEDKSSVLGRRITKQEVAETVLFALTGPQALNGSILTINGGK